MYNVPALLIANSGSVLVGCVIGNSESGVDTVTLRKNLELLNLLTTYLVIFIAGGLHICFLFI